ncbi:MAG: cytochrome c oxidase accessory protein CcoG [Candidatus Methylacidiphilales bacterium]|nr:cytochrome c oxidase accessory protein CcoG [Candidatus Methylacidiphilales bacterium]
MKPRLPERDSVTTINEDGSRHFLHPADVRGPFTLLRRLSGWIILGIFIALPWIQIGGHPAVFLDVADRRFHLFGLTAAAQDLWLFFFFITGLGFSLFFLTALLGRVWCGWACPQTLFMEHVFRAIERLIEGDAPARRRLDQQSWSAEKWLKRGFKHALFLLLSLIVAHIALSYFVSIPGLWAMMHQSPADHFPLFLLVLALAGVFYFDFAWFREQFCIILCPYGRFQSALIDDHSLVIGYDEKRGEPRGKAGATTGDCIDCRRCVQVCPTGIDIRQGLQMECIGCANCIDACDEIMDKLERPRGLVRYDSLNGLAGRKTRWLRPRIVLYSILLALGACVAGYALTYFQPASLTVLRMTGAPYYLDGNMIRNQFMVRVANKEHHPLRLRLGVESPAPGLIQSGFGDVVEIPAECEIQQPIVFQIPRDRFRGSLTLQLRLETEDGKLTLRRRVPFLGPDGPPPAP